MIRKPKLSIDIEKMLSLSGHVYWKDERGFYLGCNDNMAENLGLKNRHEIVGMSDYDTIVPRDSALMYQQQDIEVIQCREAKQYLDYATYSQGKQLAFQTLKMPIFNGYNKLVAVLGVSNLINSMVPQVNLDVLGLGGNTQISTPLKQEGQIFKSLSAREQQCLYHICRGYSAAAISEKLSLSKRTVEDYIERVKNKLGCFNRAELVQLALDKGFLNFYQLNNKV